MSKRYYLLFLALAGLTLLAILIYQIPPLQSRIAWHTEILTTYLRGLIYPAGPVPTAAYTPETATPAASLNSYTPTPFPLPTLAPPTREPAPPQAALPVPEYEREDMNNCGPATLTMLLRYYGWDGDQYDISDIVKPKRIDRNVNPDEMVYYVRNYAGWLRAEYRVGGDLALLKRLIAAGFPVIIEETFIFDTDYWPNDDRWAAHYMLLTAYNDSARTFTGQDPFHGPDQAIPYDVLLKNWEPFNYVYLLIYLPDQEDQLRDVLGSDWDVDVNRRNTLAAAQNATASNPGSAFVWFNLGTNLVAFKNYAEAARAYDTARSLGTLPQRMMRYQFGPFIAYFHALRTDDLLELTKYALQRTPNSEEALLWNGWALYRQGNTAGALADWQKALAARPGYPDAQYAIDFARSQP